MPFARSSPDRGCEEKMKPIRLIALEGEAAERGRQYGVQAAAEIRQVGDLRSACQADRQLFAFSHA